MYEEIMVYGRIVGFAVCILCALPFYLLALTGGKCDLPLAFCAGDDTLKDKIRNVSAYNQEMSRLYLLSAVAFAAAALGFLIHPLSGALPLTLTYTVGFYAGRKVHKRLIIKHGFNAA